MIIYDEKIHARMKSHWIGQDENLTLSLPADEHCKKTVMAEKCALAEFLVSMGCEVDYSPVRPFSFSRLSIVSLIIATGLGNLVKKYGRLLYDSENMKQDIYRQCEKCRGKCHG